MFKNYTENLIPTMTSPTSPSGKCSASSQGNSPHLAFDRADTRWITAVDVGGKATLSYEFPSTTVVNKYSVKYYASYVYHCIKSWTFEGSMDGNNWTILDTRKNISDWILAQDNIKEFTFTNADEYLMYRLNITETISGNFVTVGELAMFKHVPDNRTMIYHDGNYKILIQEKPLVPTVGTIVPIMTSNTAPSGEAKASSVFNTSYQAFRAFDGNNNVGWITPEQTKTGWISYEFTEPKRVVGISMISRQPTNSMGEMPRLWQVQGYDGTKWVTIYDRTIPTVFVQSVKQKFYFDNANSYKAYRLNVAEISGGLYVAIGEIEFFGVEKEATESGWNTVSNTLPVQQQFADEGMDNLEILNRKTVKIKPLPMTDVSDTIEGYGKIFSASINLKKYFDIKSIEVK
ncbi:discoidin domain-containing protein [Lysinibacillus sphaericus]|uniref:F5/8 type C domain-containing protein n=1 Tax=Lysinibacillus sphaericus OT4b.31 TaxID=1285586 RepID=R7ZFN3_LYSSH|nr:discoidin domain-containing protein [Lysinibacillus sphaericus]EON72829.1 hypothetical protein H131_08978 [Lysinibacillus sphaericus OT4b.31]